MTLVEIIKNKKLDLDYNILYGTDKECVHQYCSKFYDKEFEKYKDKEIKLLEIGVYFGGSLILWDNYFEKGTLLGIDVEERNIRENVKDCKKVEVKICDAYQKEFVDGLENFDIIIDDGPHSFESQCKFIELYCNKLNKNGVLIVEDILNLEYTEKFKELVPSSMSYEVLDIRHGVPKADNILFVVRN